MTRAALPSREPGQLGPQGTPHVAPEPPLAPGWTLLRGAPPDTTSVPALPTLPLLLLLPIHFNQWLEDLLGMLAGWGTEKMAKTPSTFTPLGSWVSPKGHRQCSTPWDSG